MDDGPPPRRTVYRVAAPRRRGRGVMLVAVVALALLAAAVAAGAVLLRGETSGAGPVATASGSAASSAPAATARVEGLADLAAHRGETATIGYRVSAPAGTAWAVTLVVRGARGARVLVRRVADSAEPGGRLSAHVPVALSPGDYQYALELAPADATASRLTAATHAGLRVLAPLPPGVPRADAVEAALGWAGGRDGVTGVAVVDTNGKDAGGLHEHRTFQAASLAKAILLVASLRDDPTPDTATQQTLTSMIEQSDNGAAYMIYDRVGAAGMRGVAKAAGMVDYEQGTSWIDTLVSAADQARFFYDLESLVPAAGRDLARRLLSGITEMQRWGIPAATGPEGWTTYFKGGWLGLDNKLMVQAAWLEKGKKRWALAVLTDDNPTKSYGWDTEKGVTGLLLGQEPTPAYLALVLE